MLSIAKQLLINKFNLPKEIIDVVKEYVFHKIKQIPENDDRYQMLLTIPVKEYDPMDNSIYIYLHISEEKDYFLVYRDYKIYLQTFGYRNNNTIYFIEGSIVQI